ncbi:MAG: cyclopropane-fatty-acyl-phospholipid synthase family protein [Acidobacteriota bacterium]
MRVDDLLASGRVPDSALRFAIRRLVGRRLRHETRGSSDLLAQRQNALEATLRASPIAIATDEANEQHYELPTEFFRLVLGRRLKYSSAYWPAGVRTLDAAEESMLDLSCRRALLADGQDILELGCGWGSLTVWMAEHYPNAQILAVSNSATQRAEIERRLASRGLRNVEVRTDDMRRFDPGRRFDRVISIEMFEHMRNYALLFERVAGWMRPDALAFVHVFCHRAAAYLFEPAGGGDWLAQHFFTGGTMPSADLFARFDRHLRIVERWMVAGAHYQRTADAWLDNLDAHRAEVWPILQATYGAEEAGRWLAYWRVFFMACAELFGFRHGEEWMVGHYRFARAEGGA